MEYNVLTRNVDPVLLMPGQRQRRLPGIETTQSQRPLLLNNIFCGSVGETPIKTMTESAGFIAWRGNGFVKKTGISDNSVCWISNLIHHFSEGQPRLSNHNYFYLIAASA